MYGFQYLRRDGGHASWDEHRRWPGGGKLDADPKSADGGE